MRRRVTYDRPKCRFIWFVKEIVHLFLELFNFGFPPHSREPLWYILQERHVFDEERPRRRHVTEMFNDLLRVLNMWVVCAFDFDPVAHSDGNSTNQAGSLVGYFHPQRKTSGSNSLSNVGSEVLWFVKEFVEEDMQLFRLAVSVKGGV